MADIHYLWTAPIEAIGILTILTVLVGKWAIAGEPCSPGLSTAPAGSSPDHASDPACAPPLLLITAAWGLIIVVMGSQYIFGWRIILHKKANSENVQARSSMFQELLPAMK